MSYKKRIVGKEIYNPVSRFPSPGGLKQYIQPRSSELSGKNLELHLDDLSPVCIHFMDSRNLAWAYLGECLRWERYECVKGDETTFMVSFLLSERTPATCVTLVWDIFAAQITAVIATLGEDECKPRLVTSKAHFGVQKQDHKPLSPLRHGYTNELVGKRIIWQYNPNDEVMHIYHSKTHLRLGVSEARLIDPATQEQKNGFSRYLDRVGIYPYYEEPAYYIKIKEGMYLYSVTESTMNHLLPAQGGSELLVLLNAQRERYIGRIFGIGPLGAVEMVFIGAIGRFGNVPDEVEAIPFPIYRGD